MKKVTFYKTMFNSSGKPPKIVTASGYQSYYTITGTDIEISLCFDKRASDWVITEESSGLSVLSGFKTRAEAEKAVTPELLRKIHEVLPSNNKYIQMVNIERGKRYAG